MRYLYFFFFLFSFNICFSSVKTGLEVLRDEDFSILKNKRVALLTNPTGVDRNLESTIDILFKAENVNLVALFAPEHGVRGDEYAGVSISNGKDKKTGLPIFSLHGKVKRPTAEMLKNIDVIVYDIQDIGCRSYTFISSLGLLMDAAGEYNKEVVVLDRPNPLGGYKVEGPVVEKNFVSFVSQFAIPYIYGLTCGELAQMLNNEGFINHKCKLTVVEMKGWSRDMTFEDTGLPWVLTSPHIPQTSSAVAYPSSGIIGELNFLSIGVGYTLPFETFAATWINADSLASALNDLRLEGVIFRPITYKPFYSNFKNNIVSGVQFYIIDYDKVNITEIQFYVLQEIHKLYPEKNPFTSNIKSFDNVCGTDKIRKSFMKKYLVSDMIDIWRKDIESFKKKSKKYWRY